MCNENLKIIIKEFLKPFKFYEFTKDNFENIKTQTNNKNFENKNGQNSPRQIKKKVV